MYKRFGYPAYLTLLTLLCVGYTVVDKFVGTPAELDLSSPRKFILFLLFAFIGALISLDGWISKQFALSVKDVMTIQFTFLAVNILISIFLPLATQGLQIFNIILAIYLFAAAMQNLKITYYSRKNHQ